MIDGILSLVKRNGDGPAVAGSFDSKTDRGGVNGDRKRIGASSRPGSYCISSNSPNPSDVDPVHPETEIAVPDHYSWTLEVRHDQTLLGTMHSHNPFVLISYFRDYTVFYGDPQPPFTVWLRHRDSDRGAPMTTQFGEAVWIDFLRELDPEIEDNLEDSRAITERSSMFNNHGHPTNPDSVFEQAFGVA